MNLTQKYRPKTFERVIGQKMAVKTVQGMIDKGLPPTILIDGPHAVGKTTIARILARRVNCLQPDGYKPCGTCDSCKIDVLQHPCILEKNAAEERGIETIRHLNQVARLAPRFKKRLVIMDEAHAMTPQAYQAGLKLFEEPGPATTFVLVTTDPQKMPKTILSRCAQVHLKRIAAPIMAKWLVQVAKREKLDLEAEAAKYLAEASGGHPREALHMLEQVMMQDGDTDQVTIVQKVAATAPRQLTAQFLKSALDYRPADCFKLYDHIDSPARFLQGLVELCQALVRMTIDPKLIDGSYRAQLKGIKCKTADAAIMLEVFGKALQQVKQHVLDDDIVLDLAILEATKED